MWILEGVGRESKAEKSGVFHSSGNHIQSHAERLNKFPKGQSFLLIIGETFFQFWSAFSYFLYPIYVFLADSILPEDDFTNGGSESCGEY
jgi:hypothetical protein